MNNWMNESIYRRGLVFYCKKCKKNLSPLYNTVCTLWGSIHVTSRHRSSLLENSQDRGVIQGISQFFDYEIACLYNCLIHLCAAPRAPSGPNKQEVNTSNFTTVEVLTVPYWTDCPISFLPEHLIPQRPQKNIVVPFLTHKHFRKGVV
jgi:hypothetical protein